MNTTAKNQQKLLLFCCILGAFAGAVIWIFLKIVSEGTALIWEIIPGMLHVPYFTVLVCTAGGLLIGLFRRKYGDYPEELNVVLGKVKSEKRYEYKNMLILLLSALFPLLLGSSVGPEAGMTGVIAALCYWTSENLKFARQDVKDYSEIGFAVTLGVLFHSPLFGIFAVAENDGDAELPPLTKSNKILLYGLSLTAATACYLLLSRFFGAGMEGFPSFSASGDLVLKDYLMIIVYIIAGCVLAVFYDLTHKGCHTAASRIPPVLREGLGGLCLGLAGTFVPAVMFSGEEQMAVLMEHYTEYLPWMLAGASFLKILITNICIQSGLKGGHFFPVIFAGVCLGYAIAMFAFAESGGHVVFAAAVVTAALLGGIMQKPLAVTMLLFICFPVKMFLWIFLAALAGSRLLPMIHSFTPAT